MIVFDTPDPKKAKANRKKHGVTLAEGGTVLYDEAALTIIDNESDPNEERYVSLGLSATGRLLVVCYTYRGELIRMISARPAHPHEHEEYSQV